MNNIKDFRGTFWTNLVWLWQAFLARKSKFLKQVDKTTFLHACSLWFFQKILHRNPTCIELFLIHVCFKIDTTYMAEIVARRLLCWSSSTVKLFPRCFAYHNKPSSIFDSGQFKDDFQSELRSLRTLMFIGRTRWNANRCYSLRTTYLIFETFQSPFPTDSLIFTAVKLFHEVIWARTKY